MQLTRASSDVLATLLDPVDVATFFDQYFERSPLHVARHGGMRWDNVYGIADLEEALAVGSRDVERFALVKTGAPPLPPEQYTVERTAPRARATGRPPQLHLDPRALAAAFDRGYSMLIKDASFFSGRLQRLCTALQRRLSAFVQANVYLTPPRAQGFALHHDTHDTLILQLDGTKTWRIHRPLIELPIESQPFHGKDDDPRVVLEREVTLEAGDTLYIPRGFAHAAATSASRSLHLTFALLPVRIVDVLDALMRLAPLNDVELRRSLPVGWLDAPDFAARMQQLAVQRFAAACTPNVVAAARELLANDLFAQTRTDAGDVFAQVEHAAALAPSDVVRLRDDVPYRARVQATSFELVLPGKSISYPTGCVPLLRRLESGAATVAELDAVGSDGMGRAFAKALVLEGLATLDERA
jgi:uncharacterized RmlC-like cupin family protein